MSVYKPCNSYHFLLFLRLHIGIRLLLALIEDEIETEHIDNHSILQPRQMTIGCCFENFRKKCQVVVQKLVDKNSIIKNSDYQGQDVVIASKKHEKTQTELIALNKCDSCASAMSCMKNLLSLFELHQGDIYKTEHIQSRIYELTQFGCMMQTTCSIEKSLKSLLGKMIDKENENVDLNHKMKALNKELQKKNAKLLLLEQEKVVLNEKNKKNAAELTQLKTKIDDLSVSLAKSESHVTALSNSTSNLNSTITHYRKESKVLLQQKLKLSENFDKMKIIIKLAVEKLPILEMNMKKIEKEHQFFSEEFGILGDVFENLNNKLGKITKNHNGLENKVKILHFDSSENAINLTKNFKTFHDRMQQLLLQSHINEVKSTESIPKIQIKGNPVEDISRQIEENNERIRMLQNENNKLNNILAKFQNLKK